MFRVSVTVNIKSCIGQQNGGVGLARKGEERNEGVGLYVGRGYSAADDSKGLWGACEPAKDQLVLMLDQGHHFQGGVPACG